MNNILNENNEKVINNEEKKGRRGTRFSIIWRRQNDQDADSNLEKREQNHRFSIWGGKLNNDKKTNITKGTDDSKFNMDKIDVFMSRNEDLSNISNNFEDEKSQRNIFQRLGSDLFFRRPSKVFEEKKEEEEEEEESESLILAIHRFFFPDSGPVIWLVFLGLVSLTVYLISLIDSNSLSEQTGISVAIIFFMDFATYLLMIILRSIIFRLLLPWLCPEGRIFAALSGTADPELIYGLWAGQITLLWKLQLVMKSDNSGYNIPFIKFPTLLSSSSASIIINSRLMVLIFALRRLVLAFIMFYFMLDFIGSMSKLMIEFLLKYRFLRLINCNWTKLRPHIVDGLRLDPGQEKNFLLSKYSSSTGLKGKPMNSGDSITLPYFLTEEGIAQIKKKKYQNWLAVQFVKQYSAIFYHDNQYIEVKNKKDARKYAKLLFNDMAQNSNEILLFMGKWKYKHKLNSNSNEYGLGGDSGEHKDGKEAIEASSILNSGDFYRIQTISSKISSSPPSSSVSSFAEEDEMEKTTKFNFTGESSTKINNLSWYRNIISNTNSNKDDNVGNNSDSNKKVSLLHVDEFKTIPSDEFRRNNNDNSYYERKKSKNGFKRYNSFIPTSPYGILTVNDYSIFDEDGTDKPLVIDIEVLKVLYGKSVESFLKVIDPSGRKSYSEDDWVRLLVTMYESRKKMINTLESQEGLAKVFRRMVSILLWFFASIFILIIFGVDVNTLVISGAAVVSSISVALNRLYSNFVSSVIFVIFENPYNQGDRVRINSGPILVVKKIQTFCTVFSTLEAVPIIYPNYWLIDQSISNETRAIQSSHIMKFYVSDLTSPFVFDAITKSIQQYANDRPEDFVPNSVYVYINSIQPGHYIETKVSFSNCSPSYEWEKLLEIRTPFYLFILHTLRQHNVEYFLPENRVLYSTWSERIKRRSNNSNKSTPIINIQNLSIPQLNKKK
ncbi:multi-pass transmembrane protein [Cryptosporidium ryanae]|uniref:multi-pass transmembrane protein n=1 Tax=Cryptosporidium ryanae TaxID=515981 RepID=UPI003519EB5E|nr:multi-pass transmembrane protein [Cryptosporidium ryanae]